MQDLVLPELRSRPQAAATRRTGLMIDIPKMDIDVIYFQIRHLKDALAYLETPACRVSMTEVARRAEIKEITARFRTALINRTNFESRGC